MDPPQNTSPSGSFANTDGYRTERLKLIGVLFVIVLIAIAVGVSLYDHFTLGRITVYTNDSQDKISLTIDQAKSYSPPILVNIGKSKSVAPGTYTLTVSGKGGAVSRTIAIRAGEGVKYTINLAGLGGLETVGDINSQDFSVGSSNLLYVDQSTQNLYQLDAQNNLSQVNGSVQFASVRWADSSFGIAQDIKGAFYFIDNGSIKPFAAPISGNGVAFAVAPNHTVFFAGGQSVFAGSPTAGFKKIYSLDQNPLAIVASDQQLALIYNSGEGPVKNSAKKVQVLDTKRILKAQKNLEALSGSWSPDAKYLLLTNSTNTQIFDSSLNQVAIVPGGIINSPTWLNGTTLLYSVNEQLWQFQVSTSVSQEIALAPKNHAIENIVLNPDDSFAYMSVQSTPSSNNDLIIQRYGLRNQSVPRFISILQSNLPWLSGRCLMYLTNFTAPSIQIYDIYPGDNCQQVAQAYVSNLKVDPSKLQYHLTNVPPDEPTD